MSVAPPLASEPWNLEQLRRQQELADSHWWLLETKQLAADTVRRHLRRGSLVLDAGAGVGAFARCLADDMTVVSMDLSSAALTIAQRRGLKRLVRSSVEALPFASGTFDAVVSLDVLYHRAVADDHAAAREAARLLRPGGVLIVNLPAYEWMRSAHDEIAGGSRRYTRRSVHRLLVQAGLTPIRVSYWNALLLPAAVAARKILRSRGSDLAPVGATMNRVLRGVLRAEALWLRVSRLPFGLSVFAIGRRPGS